MDLYDISYLVARGITLNLILTIIASVAFIFSFERVLYRIPIYLFIALMFDIGGLIIGKIYGYNLFMTPLFGLVDYFIWSRFFTPKKTKQRKQLIWTDIILVLYVSFELYRLSTGENFLMISGASLAYLFIIAVMIYSYLTAFKIESRINWLIYSFVFVYAMFKCVFYIFLNFSVYWDDEYKFSLWLFHSVLLHLFYLFLPYYQWKIGKNPQHFLFG